MDDKRNTSQARAFPNEPVAIAIDLGGTQFRVAALTSVGQILVREACATPATAEPDELIHDLADVVQVVRSQAGKHRVVGLGVAAPGPLDPVAGVVFRAPNLPRWSNVPLAARLAERTGLSVHLGNDANLAGLAEARLGAGKGEANLVYLTVSTGVGSGIVVDGRLLLGARGAAAEAGHMAVSMGGPLCSCGNRGCLEAYASGSGMVRRARDAIAAGRPSQLQEHVDDLHATIIAQAAEEGDELAQELIHDAGRALGFGVRNLLHLFNPSVVAIGGGVSRIGRRLWDPMFEVVNADTLTMYREGLRIVPAELGDDSGLVGAALLAHEAAAAPRTGSPSSIPNQRGR
ncbi:MAG TPA: ROK family protein [Chloroflexota bacterium]|nr:ROK family protein [Chloroflexota bacterium]